MVKKIKFNLSINGNSVSDIEQLQDNVSADLLDYVENQKLSKWFSVRDMDGKAQEIANIDPQSSPMEKMKVLCQVLELEDDEDIITYLLEEKEARQKDLLVKQEQTIATKSSTEESDESDGIEDSERDTKGEDWSGRDLSGRDFTGADLRGYNLSGVNLKNANLTDTNLSGCDLSKAVLTGAMLSNTDFTYCNLREAVITDIRAFKI